MMGSDGTGSSLDTLLDALKIVQDGGVFLISETGIKDVSANARSISSPIFQTMTSGTGGARKTVERTQASWIRNFEENRRLFGLLANDKVAFLGKTTHSLALYGMIETLHLGAELHLFSDQSVKQHIGLIAEHETTVLYTTPSQLLFAIKASHRGHRPAPSMRLVLIGGGKLTAQTRALATSQFPNAEIIEFYGASETSFITISDESTPENSVGRAYPGVKIKIAEKRGDELETVEKGQIWIRSPYLFDHYSKGASDQTVWVGGYLSIGEIGWLDDDGYLFLSGRAERFASIADKGVYLDEVENFLKNQTGVVDAVVLAKPDPARGNILVAFACFQSGEDETQGLLEAARGEFGPLIAPKKIVAETDWATLPSGKPDIQFYSARLEEFSP